MKRSVSFIVTLAAALVAIVMGWRLTALASPGVIQTLSDGRISVYVVNPRNDDVRVYLRARRRAAR